jgi:hypothetical protein
MLVMLLVAFFSWWYGAGWRQVAASFESRLHGVADVFSVRQLLSTLFAPWRRIITYPGASLGERMRAWSDNVFSRAIGFVVRLFVLFAALLFAALVALLTIAEVVLWPLTPLAIPGLLVAGLVV